MNNQNKKLRIKISTLPPNRTQITNEKLQSILNKVLGNEGSVCQKNCDCMMGLACQQNICTANW